MNDNNEYQPAAQLVYGPWCRKMLFDADKEFKLWLTDSYDVEFIEVLHWYDKQNCLNENYHDSK